MSLVLPDRLEQKIILANCIVGLRAGSQCPLDVLAEYCDLSGHRELDTLVEMLLTATTKLVGHIMSAAQPVKYVRGVVDCKLVEETRQAPQSSTVPLELVPDGRPAAALARAGIDIQRYIDDLRATGKPKDARLARTISRWGDGATRKEIGDAAYMEMLRFLGQPRAKVIARRTKKDVLHVADWMAAPEWFCTISGRPDSVWHCQNRDLLR